MRASAETAKPRGGSLQRGAPAHREGELVLGQAISRRRLAAELGTELLPVTEALLRLEFEGLLESRPRAGTRVRFRSQEDVEGNYVVREALETQAAILFSQRGERDGRSELRRLATRVDALSMKSDRSMHWRSRIRSCITGSPSARCDALREAIEKTHRARVASGSVRCGSRRPTIRRAGTRICSTRFSRVIPPGSPKPSAAISPSAAATRSKCSSRTSACIRPPAGAFPEW